MNTKVEILEQAWLMAKIDECIAIWARWLTLDSWKDQREQIKGWIDKANKCKLDLLNDGL